MKKNTQKRSSIEKHDKVGFGEIIRNSLQAIRILHRGLGAPRIIVSYIFALFAMLSLSFTIKVPLASNFLPPTGWAKVQSRAISGLIMLMNLFVFGMIMNWRRGSVGRTIFKLAFIGSTIFLDTTLIRTVYTLIKDGTFF
jgi:hypothetical protein